MFSQLCGIILAIVCLYYTDELEEAAGDNTGSVFVNADVTNTDVLKIPVVHYLLVGIIALKSTLLVLNVSLKADPSRIGSCSLAKTVGFGKVRCLMRKSAYWGP